MTDIAAALTTSLARDGRGGMLGDLSMNGNSLTALASGVADSDAATVAQMRGATQGPPGGNVMSIGPFTITQNPADPIQIPAGAALVQTSGWATPGIGPALYFCDGTVTPAYVTAHPLSSFIDKDGNGYQILTENGVSVAQFGANGDSTDQTAAVLEAASLGVDVYFPIGKYNLTGLGTGAVVLTTVQTVYADAPGTPGKDDGAFVYNDTPGGGLFAYTGDTSTAAIKSPEVTGLHLRADFPIRFNDERTAVIADGGGNCPPLLRARVINNTIQGRVNGVGTGLSMTKCFDGTVEGNTFSNFDVSLLLLGSDLNSVRNNRLQYAKRFHVLELSVGTFGSQNRVEHNDILYVQAGGCPIFSTARHARYIDNYLEQDVPVRAFFCFSTFGAPQYNGQAPGERFSIIARENRIDGHSLATVAVYEVQVSGLIYCDIEDVGTSGPTSSTPELLLTDANGAAVSGVPVLFNQQNQAQFSFRGPRFGPWNGFLSGPSFSSLTINARTLGQFGGQLYANRADQFLALAPNEIIVDSALGNVGYPRPFAMPYAGFLKPSTQYSIVMNARTLSGTETVYLGGIINGAGAGGKFATITTTPMRLFIGFTTSSDPSALQGPYIECTSHNGNKIAVTLELSRSYDQFVPKTVQDSSVYTPVNLSGEISLSVGESTEAANLHVNKLYRFIGSTVLVELSVVPNAAVLDGNLALNPDGTITVTLSGSAANKYYTLGHNYDRVM